MNEKTLESEKKKDSKLLKDENNHDLEVSKSKNNKLEKWFKFSDLNTILKKEIVGGISTFLAMVYILSVEPDMLSQAKGIDGTPSMSAGGVFLATVLISFLTTALMGIFANLPIGMSPSMGVNAMFTFTISNNSNIGYQGALIATCLSSILFFIFSLTKIRKIIIESIPHSLNLAIGSGIGCFIAYVGISSMGWVSHSGGVPVASLSNLKDTYVGIIIGMVVFSLILIFHTLKIPGAIAIAIAIGLILSLIIANTAYQNNAVSTYIGSSKWKGWSYSDFSGLWTNLKNIYSEIGNKKIWSSPTLYISSLVFILLIFFDATGTITSLNRNITHFANLPERNLPKTALIIDSLSSVLGSTVGLSHMTAYVESNVGIAAGARTGVAAIVIAIFFGLAVILYPLFSLIPPCVTAGATLFVGSLMFLQIKNIEWAKPEITISTFVLLIFMIVTYDITNGIAVGIITYTVVACAAKKIKEISPILWILNVVFIIYFVAFAFL
ncbi:NCS2 family permease [Spiroplasma endosymbiont of Labia minor]|uniref:NCS2 family permease n=1 Tax=Spiroplasma endosymbiont of Labia minor TaxID=3066305 RepID=UPI0030D27B85